MSISANDKNRVAIALLVVALVIVALLLWKREQSATPTNAAATEGVPLVMHTSGGRLEVATVDNIESFTLKDARELFGLDLGTTVSVVKVRVKYRYYIDMAKEWPIQVSGQTAIVEAGEIRPQLPVAIDTTTMEVFTSNGWARFNKYENLEKLERSLSATLAMRANGYRGIAVEASRKTVSDFVSTWLLHNLAKDARRSKVKVFFPGEDRTQKAGKSEPAY
jgi:hypothetical protein